MNQEQQIFSAQAEIEKKFNEIKESYKAPQVTVHGKLERLTLQDNYGVPPELDGNEGV